MPTRMKCTRIAAAILGLSLAAYLVGCGKEEPAGLAGVEVTVVKVTPQDIPVSIEFVGKTQSSRRVEIRSRVEGFLEKRLYTEGTLVQEGQALFQMDQKPFQAQLDAARAELAQQKARLRAHRQRPAVRLRPSWLPSPEGRQVPFPCVRVPWQIPRRVC